MFRDESHFTAYYMTRRREVTRGKLNREFSGVLPVVPEKRRSLREKEGRGRKREKENDVAMSLEEKARSRLLQLQLPVGGECNRVVISS